MRVWWHRAARPVISAVGEVDGRRKSQSGSAHAQWVAAPSLTPLEFPGATVPPGNTAAESGQQLQRGVPWVFIPVDQQRGSVAPRDRNGGRDLSGHPAGGDRLDRAFLRPQRERVLNLPETPTWRATFSAVPGIASVPKRSCILGLTNRQPIVVSAISAFHEYAISGLGSTNGERLMLSTHRR